MANHLWRQIREAVVARVTGLATTGAHVFQPPIRQIPDSSLPCLVVSNDGEEMPEVLTQGWPRREARQLTVFIKLVAKESSDLNNVVEQILKEIEIAMATDYTLGGLAKNVQRGSIQPSQSLELEKPAAEITITYFITYHAKNNAPDVAL